MTVSLDARTPSATVHALSGSTPPGASTTMQPFGIATTPIHEMPDTFTPLGAAAADVAAGLTARRDAAARPDAEVIDLAGRVKALAARENKTSGWVGTIEDHITFKGPQHPMCDDPRPGAKGQMREMGLLDLRAMLAKELPHSPDPEWIAAVEASSARMEAHEAAVQAMEDRFGLARIEKRRRRMFLRLVRWATRLTAMAPATHAGLKAKAEAQLAVDRAGNFDNWTQDLAGSVGRDAISIITSEAEERAREAEALDGDLLSLIARHGPALAKWEAADEASDPVRDAYCKIEPARPPELYGRLSDGPLPRSGREKPEGSATTLTVYTVDDIAQMRTKPVMQVIEHHRPADWDPKDTIVRHELVPDGKGEIRRTEILAAWDRWEAEKAALRESTGLNAANAACEIVATELNQIEDAIFDLTPRTFEGLQAKARWIASLPVAKARAEHVLHDLCRMPPVAMVPPAQVTPSHDVVETYRTFLLMELRYLDHEVYGDPDGRRMGYFMDNPAGAFHHDAPPPSTRAATVLSALGLMPNTSAEDKHDAATRAA